MLSYLIVLWSVLKPSHRRQLVTYFIFSLFLSFSEIFLLYSFRYFALLLTSSSPPVPFYFLEYLDPVIFGCLLLIVASINVNICRLVSSYFAFKAYI